MKLKDIKRICIAHLKKGCITCPGYYKDACMFGNKPPGLWRNEEISNYVENVRRDKFESNTGNNDIHKTTMG